MVREVQGQKGAVVSASVVRNFSKSRPAGPVSVRWFGGTSGQITHGRTTLRRILSRAADRWFASNHSPDAFVMLVVIERDGHTMSDEEADAYIRDQLALKRAGRLR